MRRLVAFASAVALVCSLAGSAAGAAPPDPRPLFVGDFELLTDDGLTLAGRISAQLSVPTSKQLVPGTYAFHGAPGWVAAESRAVVGSVGYWFDPGHEGGSNVVYFDGAECLYFVDPGNIDCRPFAVMFIDVVDPSLPNQVAVTIARNESGEWDFGIEGASSWWKVGRGAFVVNLPAES